MKTDKLLHFLVGVAIAVSTDAAVWLLGLPTLFYGVGSLVACLAGELKERYDEKHLGTHTPDGWDAYWTAAGGSVGALICMAVALML